MPIRRGLSDAECERIADLFTTKIAYHEAGHAVCLIHCGVQVKGVYLYPAEMPEGSPSSLGCCHSDLRNYELRYQLFSCAGACFAEELAPCIGELRSIASSHALAPVRRDVNQMLRAARAEYNAHLLTAARSLAGRSGVSEKRMRTILKENMEREHNEFCTGMEFVSAVHALASLLLDTRTVTSQEVLCGHFLGIPVRTRK